MNRLEFHISYTCRNNCIFCSEKVGLEKFKGGFICKNTIKNKLRSLAVSGYNHVTFTGGEPTLHPNISDILKCAKKCGYRTFITTNGGEFCNKRFCNDTLPYINEISFSIHGHNKTLHNKLTKNRRSFARLLKALQNIEQSKEKITAFANVVLLPQNFEHLEKIILFISRFKKIKQVLLSNLAPEGEALKNYNELVIPLQKIKNAIPKIIRYTEKKGLIARFFGIPLCALPGFESYSNDLHWTPRSTLEQNIDFRFGVLKKTLSLEPTRNRVKQHFCFNCPKVKLCGGIFRQYTATFHDENLSKTR